MATRFPRLKFLNVIILFLIFLSILLTGERSNTLKISCGIVILFLFADFIKMRSKIILLTFITTVIILIVIKSPWLNNRYVGQIYEQVNSKEKRVEFFQNDKYMKLYKSGFEVFKNNILFGVGNKNYRIEACNNKKARDIEDTRNYVCNTHPHQIYFELLSEHGLIGTAILLSLIFFLLFKVLKIVVYSKNYIQKGSFIFVIMTFLPILPSGSFFSDFNATIFWINFSLIFASNPSTNIFNDKTQILNLGR